MITREQIDRVDDEFTVLASMAFEAARNAERTLECAKYEIAPHYDHQKVERLMAEFQEADYQAESRAWVRNLIREAKKQ